MTAPIRVLLADDFPLVRAGLRAALAAADDLALVGEATTGEEVWRLAEELRPDVLLLDLRMPGPPASATVARLRATLPATQVVVLTAHDDRLYARELVALGVAGYVLKDEPLDAVVGAIRTVAAGGTWFSRAILPKLVPGRAAGPAPELTARERQLLRLLALGWETARIAATLGVTEQTLRNYLSRLYGRLGVHTRAEATAWAQAHDLADA